MKFSALLYFVLSLFGCDVGRSTFVDRIGDDGVHALYSRATVEAGVARFECLRSASGHCYYTVLPRDCDAGRRGCSDEPLRRFAVANGDSRQIVGLHDFRLCVSDRDATPEADCRLPQPTVAR
jgi:hypothetical protein